jgi:hypothetical protein
MSSANFDFKSGDQLSPRSILIWRIAQIAVWLVGATILTCLLFFPKVGVILFWNILIPVAPALFVVAVGIWRNVCPLATTNLLPRQFGLSKRKKLTATQLGQLNLVAVFALYVIVPLRHAVFNNNGVATGLMIVAMAVIGVTLGFFYEWKSAWCSGLCPVHPVEKLYGGNVLLSIPNANCDQCMNCVIPCPDSTPNLNPKISAKTIYHKISGLLIIGGLPGFIWGWFHVPDEAQIVSFPTFLNVYQLPLIGLAVTMVAYLILSNIVDAKYERKLIGIFAASGVSCYYWYRLPALIGFGKFADDGLLYSLKGVIPDWVPVILPFVTTAFFFYWLVIRKRNNRSWVVRPQFADKASNMEHSIPA